MSIKTVSREELQALSERLVSRVTGSLHKEIREANAAVDKLGADLAKALKLLDSATEARQRETNQLNRKTNDLLREGSKQRQQWIQDHRDSGVILSRLQTVENVQVQQAAELKRLRTMQERILETLAKAENQGE